MSVQVISAVSGFRYGVKSLAMSLESLAVATRMRKNGVNLPYFNTLTL
jgi:hypothetical protein